MHVKVQERQMQRIEAGLDTLMQRNQQLLAPQLAGLDQVWQSRCKGIAMHCDRWRASSINNACSMHRKCDLHMTLGHFRTAQSTVYMSDVYVSAES